MQEDNDLERLKNIKATELQKQCLRKNKKLIENLELGCLTSSKINKMTAYEAHEIIHSMCEKVEEFKNGYTQRIHLDDNDYLDIQKNLGENWI